MDGEYHIVSVRSFIDDGSHDRGGGNDDDDDDKGHGLGG